MTNKQQAELVERVLAGEEMCVYCGRWQQQECLMDMAPGRLWCRDFGECDKARDRRTEG